MWAAGVKIYQGPSEKLCEATLRIFPLKDMQIGALNSQISSPAGQQLPTEMSILYNSGRYLLGHVCSHGTRESPHAEKERQVRAL